MEKLKKSWDSSEETEDADEGAEDNNKDGGFFS